jgi:hypothetical protein
MYRVVVLHFLWYLQQFFFPLTSPPFPFTTWVGIWSNKCGPDGFIPFEPIATPIGTLIGEL